MENNKIKWYQAKTSNVVALISVISIFLLIAALFVFEVPEGNKQLLTYVIGSVLTTVLGGAIYYLFQYKSPDK